MVIFFFFLGYRDALQMWNKGNCFRHVQISLVPKTENERLSFMATNSMVCEQDTFLCFLIAHQVFATKSKCQWLLFCQYDIIRSQCRRTPYWFHPHKLLAEIEARGPNINDCEGQGNNNRSSNSYLSRPFSWTCFLQCGHIQNLTLKVMDICFPKAVLFFGLIKWLYVIHAASY